jgi:tetratricopeptide (TPR) repeat protein
LVSQLVHVLKLDEALVVAKQATERFPHLSRTWLDLATVHQHRGVLQDEIAALERACDIDPTLTTSARALAAAYERGGQMDQARAAYERAMRHSAFDGMLHAAYASLLWRQRLPQEACASVEQALRLTPGLPFAWAQLSDWSAQSGDPMRVVQFARALSSERGGEPEVWLSLARYLPTTQMAEALAAVERALQLDRQSIDAWDLKATLLAVAERFDEAVKACMEGMAACAADVHLLAGRRAWVEAQRRQMPEAIRQIKEVLANNQGYAWGWHELVSWLLHTEATAEALDALDRMRKIWPHDPAVNRKRAFLLLRQGNKPAAKEAFAAVLAASPTDVSAAHNLLDLQLEASDMQGARATLDAMQTHQPGAPTLAVEIRLHLHARNVDAACAALERLCASRDPDAWPMDSACELFRHAQASDRALRIIERALRLPDVHPHAGAAIVRLLAARMMFVRATRFFLKLPPGELRRHAALPLVQAFAENKCRLLLRLVLWRRSEALRADDLAWGQVGYALVNVKRMQKAVDWLSDWRARPNVQSWMLFNYCLALRYLGRYEEANDVAEHVIQTWGHREGSGDMHLFLAIERALVGATRAAQEHLQRASVRSNVRYDQQMLALTKALVEFHSTPPAQRRGRFAAIKGALSEQFAAPTLVKSMRDVRRTFWRAAEVFRRDGAGFDAWLWSRWKLHWQWSLLLTIPAIGAVGLALGVAMVHGLSPGIIILVAVLSFLRRSQR